MPMLMFYRLVVMVELFTAEFLFAFRLHKRNLFILRFLLCVSVGAAFVVVLPLFYNAFYTSFVFFMLFLITVPMLKFCCDEDWRNIFFCAIAAYTMQHFAYGVARIFTSLASEGASPILGMYFDGNLSFENFNLQTLLMGVLYVFAYFLSYTFFWFVFIRKIRRGENFRITNIKMMAIIGIAVIVDIFLNSIVVYYSDDDNLLTTVMNIVYENLCCFFLLYIQFRLLKTGELENELNVTQYLLHEQERQYSLSQKNIELINMKCHDLRHQIRSIGKDKSLPEEAVHEIESAITVYDSAVRTDNEVLDTILTEKSLICSYNDIALTCVADGHSLEFMQAADVYSLFGNALDNAIDAVMRLDKEKRNIGVVVRSVGDMVSINICNQYEGTIELDDDGFPITTKEDRDYHGIGTKSMRNIAERYNGICSVALNNGTFILNVLLSKNKTE